MNIPTEFVPIGLVDSEKIKNRQDPFCLLLDLLFLLCISDKKITKT